MKCPKCGMDNANDSVFCVYCGAKISKTGVQEQPKSKVQPVEVQAKTENSHKKRNIIATIVAVCAVLIGGAFYYNHTQAEKIEKGIKVISGLRDDCDRMTSSLSPGPEGLKNLENAVVALRRLDDFENMFIESHPEMAEKKVSEQAMAMFIAKIKDIQTAIKESMRTTMANFDKKSVMYLGAQHRLEVIERVLNDWENSESKSAKDIHIDADDYMN